MAKQGPVQRGVTSDPIPPVRPAPDRIAKTTCYMCACRCGIDVHVRDGVVAHIEGNRDHPVNHGVICAKGSAGLAQHRSGARLRGPMLRTGPRGSGQFQAIGWDEALRLATDWLAPVRARDPKGLAFFTGRDQSQSLTSWWAQAFGTPNYAAHGGFCSVNMAAAGIYTLGGSFWEFGATDWDRTRLHLMFGVAEDHDSNPIKIGLGRLKSRGARVIAVNPVRTGYGAIADDWFGITPGTDGLLILALVHELLRTARVDFDYLARWTDAAHLVSRNPGAGFGLILRDGQGRALVWDRGSHSPQPFDRPGLAPALRGDFPAPGGRAEPVFALMARKYLDPQYAPDQVAGRTGIAAARIRALAADLARAAFDDAPFIAQPWTDFRGEDHPGFIGRPVAVHAMRGISAHANGFQTCRALHLLQLLLGAVESPGGFRFKPPYPKPVAAHPTPHCTASPGRPLGGPHLGFPRGPQDLALDAAGDPARIDKAFSWEAPLAVHGLMHRVIGNAHAGDPYPVEVLMLYMANMAWNSSMDPAGVMAKLTDRRADGDYVIPKIIYSDAYASEMVAFADLVLPDTTYLERHDCISLLDRPISEPEAAADAIRWPVVAPDRDVRGFQSVLIDLGARLGLPGFVDAAGAPAYADYADYIVRHERRPGVGPLSGWRAGGAVGRGAPNPGQLDAYIAAGGVHRAPVPAAARFMKPFNRAYQDWAVGMGFYDTPQPYVFHLYAEPLRRFQLAAEGYGERQPPEALRARIQAAFDPLPIWWDPCPGTGLHAITQRPAAMYHSWGSQNPWLRQIHGENAVYVHPDTLAAAGLGEGDWAWITSAHGRIRARVRGLAAQNRSTIWTWNAIAKRPGAWGLDPGAPEATRAVLINHLLDEVAPGPGRLGHADPITGQAAWYDLRVTLGPADAPGAEPRFDAVALTVAL